MLPFVRTPISAYSEWAAEVGLLKLEVTSDRFYFTFKAPFGITLKLHAVSGYRELILTSFELPQAMLTFEEHQF